MEKSTPDPTVVRATSLTRALCLLILLLMATAAIYGAAISLRYFSRIGV